MKWIYVLSIFFWVGLSGAGDAHASEPRYRIEGLNMEWYLVDTYTHEEFHGRSFYEKLGRPDLAQEYDENLRRYRRFSRGGGVGIASGIGVLVGGFGLMGVEVFRSFSNPNEPNIWPFIVGTSAVFLGSAGIWAGVMSLLYSRTLTIQPASGHQVRRMVGELNADGSPRSSLRPEITIMPFVSPIDSFQGGMILQMEW